METMPSQCLACTRFQRRPLTACAAFPDGIPEEILIWGADHRAPFPGDGGVRFELAEGLESRDAFEQWNAMFNQQNDPS